MQPNGMKAFIVQMVPLLLIFAALFYIPWSAQRKEKKKRDEMMSALKKDLKVRTVGGICGVIQEVREDEVILKVDPRTDTCITFSKSSITAVI